MVLPSMNAAKTHSAYRIRGRYPGEHSESGCDVQVRTPLIFAQNEVRDFGICLRGNQPLPGVVRRTVRGAGHLVTPMGLLCDGRYGVRLDQRYGVAFDLVPEVPRKTQPMCPLIRRHIDDLQSVAGPTLY